MASVDRSIAEPGRSRPRALTIAGSDSGGGAGIQADLKTFAAFGVYGASAITAVTAQNTLGVAAIHDVPAEIVAAQIDAVLSDIGADAVKTGMLFSTAIVEAVADRLRAHGVVRLVIDPVMIAKGGDRLLREDAVAALRASLLPLAAVVTPNAPEASVLAGLDVVDEPTAREAARRIHALGPRLVIVKGGHLGGEPLRGHRLRRHDLRGALGAADRHAAHPWDRLHVLRGDRRGARPRARRRSTPPGRRKAFLQGAIEHAEPLGAGHGPVNHLWRSPDA